MGLLTLALARARGAGTAILSDPVASRRELARRLGADLTVDPTRRGPRARWWHGATGGRGVDVACEAVGKPELLGRRPSRLTRPRGVVQLVGVCPKGSTLPADLFDFHFRELTLPGAYGRGTAFRRVLPLLPQDRRREPGDRPLSRSSGSPRRSPTRPPDGASRRPSRPAPPHRGATHDQPRVPSSPSSATCPRRCATGRSSAPTSTCPKGSGPFPALLERTPYSKDNSPECQVGSPPFFASHGYAVVIQDVRGRFASEGRFVPFHDDGWGPNRDGYDTVEWIAAQPWCDGNVGTIGGSYAGATQYRLAPTRPPHLRAMYVRESSADYWAEWVYHGGAFELGFMLEWTVKWTYNNLARLARSPEEHARRKGVLEKALAGAPELAPRAAAPPQPARRGPRRLVQRVPRPSRRRPVLVALEHRPPPRRHRDADRPPRGLVRHLPRGDAQELRRHCGPRRAPRRRATPSASSSGRGSTDPGTWRRPSRARWTSAPEAIRDYNAIRLPWFDHWLRGARNGVPDEPRVQLFVMGENRWRTADAYPWPGTRETPWYLRDGGAADAGGAGRGGGGRRVSVRPRRPGARRWAGRPSTSRAAPTTSGRSRGAASPTRARRSSAT